MSDTAICLGVQSYIRGCHAYTDNWTPVNGQTLEREPNSSHNIHAVAVYCAQQCCWPYSKQLVLKVVEFLKREAFAEIVGEREKESEPWSKVWTIEASCVYHLYEPMVYMSKEFISFMSRGSQFSVHSYNYMYSSGHTFH